MKKAPVGAFFIKDKLICYENSKWSKARPSTGFEVD